MLIETLGFMLKVGTCHYTGKIFSPKNKGLKIGLFSPFLVIFCLHNAKCPCIFLPLATVLASVITDFEILNKCAFIRRILNYYIMNVHCRDVEYRSLLSTNKHDHLNFIFPFEDKINSKIPCITYPFIQKILHFYIMKVFYQDLEYRSLLSTNKHDHLNFTPP
jgi:hypothetical protein